MRIQQIALLVLLAFCFAGAGIAQNTPRFELFVEGGGSLLNAGPAKGNVVFTCPTCALSQVVPISGSDSAAGRLFTGARFRFPYGRAARVEKLLEASAARSRRRRLRRG